MICHRTITGNILKLSKSCINSFIHPFILSASHLLLTINRSCVLSRDCVFFTHYDVLNCAYMYIENC